MDNVIGNTVYRQMPHDWQEPMPGQGTMQMCRKCGNRRKPDIEAEPCRGPNIPADPIAGSIKSDYDPFN